MTKWLASVQSLTEAKNLASCLPDILDLKNPSEGALGALKIAEVEAIVEWLDGRCLSSATVGDIPMDARRLATAITNMAETGVNYVKVGLFADDNLQACLRDLEPTLNALKTPVIAVMFADQTIDAEIASIKQAGFSGVMVDTAFKNGQRLLDHWSDTQMSTFVETAHRLQMVCGLAGALAIDDIESLKGLNADYLGFRSALCTRRQRTHNLDLTLAKQIAQSIQSEISLAS
ncbi:(5-formylfuran-3-yl)methyl phosphate synthase [Methylophaga sp.]|uniref:(5-formylfuran-3-yl)methyl phosphate synthase n=1 Tax=Methylophaga sp. TaxID=2024840 RepID=UPI003F6A016A